MKLKAWGSNLIISLILSYLTLSAIGLLSRWPNNPTFGDVADTLAYPGALIASLFFPQGIHTGRGSIGSFYMTVIGNLFFYTGLWLILKIVARIATGRLWGRRDGDQGTPRAD